MLQEHPWVTKNGTDPLLSAQENCAKPIEPPNELEVNHAFTRKMNHLLCVMKVLQKFKAIKTKKLATALEEQRLQSGLSSIDTAEHFPTEKAKAEEIEALLDQRRRVFGQDDDENGRGNGRDVSEQEPLFLGIGTGARDDFAMDEATSNIVADSPTAVDFNIYDKAYSEAVKEHLEAHPSARPRMYLTRFVKEMDQLTNLSDLIDESQASTPGPSKLADLVAKVGVEDAIGTK
jgi:[calcium/calmodulin-dependent protein kinase] kinase